MNFTSQSKEFALTFLPIQWRGMMKMMKMIR